MSGPAGVMALVLGQTAAGCAVLLWLMPGQWKEVKHGYYKVTGIIIAALGLGTWASLNASRGLAADLGLDFSGAYLARTSVALATLATVVAVGLLFARADRAARVMGLASVPLFAVLLFGMAESGTAALPSALFQLLAGSLFLGAVMNGMLLGHWYLTDRKLTRTPINRIVNVLLASVAIEVVAVIAAGFEPTAADTTFNPILTSAGLANWIALGMVVMTGFIALLVHAVLKGERATAVQSATGFLYLAVICALVAVPASMVTFLPARDPYPIRAAAHV